MSTQAAIIALYLSSARGAAMQRQHQVSVVAGKGIVGDRHFDTQCWPGQNMTLIEGEQIARFNAYYGSALSGADLRRNVVTQGIDLNALVSVTFRLGDVVLRGVELCEPCADLGNSLQPQLGIAPPEIVRAWANKAGLRCDVISGGQLHVGILSELTVLSSLR